LGTQKVAEPVLQQRMAVFFKTVVTHYLIFMQLLPSAYLDLMLQLQLHYNIEHQQTNTIPFLPSPRILYFSFI